MTTTAQEKRKPCLCMKHLMTGQKKTLTWNNAPSASGTVIAQAKVTDTSNDVINEYIEFDITDYYKSLADREDISFLLKLATTKGGGVYLTSKEVGTPPMIEITYNYDVREIKTEGENPFVAVVNKDGGVIENVNLYTQENGITKIPCSKDTDVVYVWDSNMTPLKFWIDN